MPFAMEARRGLDYRISKYFSVRPVEVDYVLTRFPSLWLGTRENQNSIKSSKPRQATSSRSARCKRLVLTSLVSTPARGGQTRLMNDDIRLSRVDAASWTRDVHVVRYQG